MFLSTYRGVGRLILFFSIVDSGLGSRRCDSLFLGRYKSWYQREVWSKSCCVEFVCNLGSQSPCRLCKSQCFFADYMYTLSNHELGQYMRAFAVCYGSWCSLLLLC